MIINEGTTIEQSLLHVAQLMVTAARTAPKAKGLNTLEMIIVEGEDVQTLANHLLSMGEALELPSFVRDAGNLRNTPVALALGARVKTMGLKKCGMCGFASCDEKQKHVAVPCVHNAVDLGIAIGSAVSVAMDNRVDNRIMYSAGQALLELGWLGSEVSVAYLIPLSATSKNIYFDR